ncbi:MAG: triose-phosphate isomerase [Actinomycetota bacterium]|nr:triose-phosphate isomerase [Actinomycetota bacterium]
MRTPLMAGNWKMNKTAGQAVHLVQDLAELIKGVKDVEVVVCPPFTALKSISTVIELDRLAIKLGAQDMYWEEKGAFTGEISPIMLKDLRVDYVIVGHSERRQYFGETDETVNKKVRSALDHELIPIVCVGETLEEREREETNIVVEKQIAGGLAGLDPFEVEKLVIAYEPIWAIGTGATATPEVANDVIRHIRAIIGSQFTPPVAKRIRILYGGSVTPENIDDLMDEPDIDGVLVGGASLDAEKFARIVRFGEHQA